MSNHSDSSYSDHTSPEDVVGEKRSQLEALLDERTKVPLERLDEILIWPEERLKTEVAEVDQILKRFASAVMASVEDPGGGQDFLRELDLKVITNDHDWRTIFSEIRVRGGNAREHRRTVMIKYLQYLSFRKRLLDFIVTRKGSLERTNIWAAFDLSVDGGGPWQGPGDGYRRLPAGDPVNLTLPMNHTVEIYLANHRFTLVGGQPAHLVDMEGISYGFHNGKNLVGRHTASDVVIPPVYNNVSRVHLTVQWISNRKVSVTDLSSKGSFVEVGAFETA